MHLGFYFYLKSSLNEVYILSVFIVLNVSIRSLLSYPSVCVNKYETCSFPLP